MKCKWLFEKSMLASNSFYDQSFDKICEKLGIEYQVLTYLPMANNFNEKPFVETPKFKEGDCVVSYGSIEAVKSINYFHKNYIPSGYIQEKSLACKTYMPNIPIDLLLNDDYLMLPYAEFVRRKESIYKIFKTNKLFIRPDSGLKTFAGTTIHYDDFDYEINTLNQLTSVQDDTIILIASIKSILKEYRVVVGNKAVIASSLYKIKDEVILKEGAPEEVLNLANTIAKLDWQPDIVYTCDIALLENGDVKVIELNSFSCAGLYACNIEDILIKVSEIALLEYNGEITL